MANNGKDRNSSQFFVTLNATPHLNGKHVVFGKVIDGLEIIKKIGTVSTDATKPLEPIMIVDCGEIKNKVDGLVSSKDKADEDSLSIKPFPVPSTNFASSNTLSFGSAATSPFSFHGLDYLTSPSSSSGVGTIPVKTTSSVSTTPFSASPRSSQIPDG